MKISSLHYGYMLMAIFSPLFRPLPPFVTNSPSPVFILVVLNGLRSCLRHTMFTVTVSIWCLYSEWLTLPLPFFPHLWSPRSCLMQKIYHLNSFCLLFCTLWFVSLKWGIPNVTKPCVSDLFHSAFLSVQTNSRHILSAFISQALSLQIHFCGIDFLGVRFLNAAFSLYYSANLLSLSWHLPVRIPLRNVFSRKSGQYSFLLPYLEHILLLFLRTYFQINWLSWPVSFDSWCLVSFSTSRRYCYYFFK